MQFARLLVLTVLVWATQAEAEAVVERPALSGEPPEGAAAGTEARGAEAVSQEGGTPRPVPEVSARQGVAPDGGGPHLLGMMFNAFNPVPYLLGGLNGVRQVMHHRLYRPPRPAQIRGPRFMNNHGGKHGAGSGGGGGSGGRHVGGGGSTGGHAGGGFNSGGGGSGGNFPAVRGREKPFHPNFHGGGDDSTSNAFNGGVHMRRPFGSASPNFDTPKPESLVGGGTPGTPPGRVTTNAVPSTSTGTSSSSSSPSNVLPSSEGENKFPRVINIQVPEEMHNLTIVEISMKANGDVTIGGESKEVSKVSPGTPSSSSSSPAPVNPDDILASLPPGVGDIFPDDPWLHRFNSETNFQEPDFLTNAAGGPNREEALPDLLSPTPLSFDSIQDILGMQSLGHTNNAFGYRMPYDWHSLNNLKANVLSNDRFNDNEYRLIQLPKSYPRNSPVPYSPVPYSPANFAPEKKNSNNIYYVPVSLPSSRPRRFSTGQSKALLAGQKQRSQPEAEASPVYYIDITIPGGSRGGAPRVNARGFKRNKRSLQYDGWFPMDVSNPMADDPTVGYQPPPLERVHFSNEPMPKKPMYPVRPENPPVFVVRSQPRQPEYHSVYGTENFQYFHIHPQTNTVRAFRAPAQSVGAFRLAPAPQMESHQPSPSAKPDTEAPENTSQNLGAYAHLLRGFDYLDIPEKEAGFADKSDTFDERTAGGNIRFPDDASYYDMADDYDMEGAFSEIHSSTVPRPGHVFPFSHRDRNSGSNTRPNIHGYRRRPDPPGRRSDSQPVRVEEAKSSRPALHELLGNLPQESQLEETPYLGSATDSGGGFLREIPPPNFRYSLRRAHNQQPQQPPEAARAPPPRETTADRPAGKRPWFLIDTRSSERKREPSIASYIQPETHSGDEKIYYRPFGPVSYISKAGAKTADGHIHNPHLDDHMNSYKPTLTANSLSELLQLFRFTHVTDRPGDKDRPDEPVTLLREFRYTRPTEVPPTTFPPLATESAANRSTLTTSYRYTPSPPSLTGPTTEAGVTKKPGKRHFDAVADTNSLDGYLFSDSEANPEYAHPRVRPNVVIIEGKDEDVSKGVVRESSRVSVSSSSTSIFPGGSSAPPDTFQELEIIYPGPPPKGTTAASWPLYIIHQGHSKVKVFGINSAEDKGLGDSGFTDIYVFAPTEPTAATAAAAAAATGTAATAPPTMTVSSSSFSSSSSSSSMNTTTLSSTTTTTPSTSTSPAPPATHSTTFPTTAFPLEDNGTTPSTFPSTDFGPAPAEGTDEYHDTDGVSVPDMAFGEDYYSEGWERPSSLSLPGSPPLTLSLLARPTPPPPTQVPDLSLDTPEAFTGRPGDTATATTTEEETHTSSPSEDLSQLRHLETDRSPAAEDTSDEPAPQPGTEGVTDAAPQA